VALSGTARSVRPLFRWCHRLTREATQPATWGRSSNTCRLQWHSESACVYPPLLPWSWSFLRAAICAGRYVRIDYLSGEGEDLEADPLQWYASVYRRRSIKARDPASENAFSRCILVLCIRTFIYRLEIENVDIYKYIALRIWLMDTGSELQWWIWTGHGQIDIICLFMYQRLSTQTHQIVSSTMVKQHAVIPYLELTEYLKINWSVRSQHCTELN
jgi:hypothetical protein